MLGFFLLFTASIAGLIHEYSPDNQGADIDENQPPEDEFDHDITGTDGDDDIDLNPHLDLGDNDAMFDLAIEGTLGELVVGGHNRISGGDGNDRILAGVDQDEIYGGDGNDTIYGDGDADGPSIGSVDFVTGGSDWIYGGAGNDIIYAEGGEDTVYAGTGNDSVSGGMGDDIVYLGDGDDAFYGGEYDWDGTYSTNFGFGDDLAYGGAGDDYLFSDKGADSLYGGEGNDRLSGLSYSNHFEYSNGYLYGGAGDDDLSGEHGDVLTGGLGTDSFHIHEELDAHAGRFSIASITDFDPAQETLSIDLTYWEDDPDVATELSVEYPADGSGAVISYDGIEIVFLEGVTYIDPSIITLSVRG